MNATEKSESSAVPEIPLPRRAAKPARGPLLWLALTLTVLALLAWSGYRWSLRTADENAAREQWLARLQDEVRMLQRQAAAQARQQTELTGSVANLSGQIEGGRDHVQRAAVEQLLLLANDRLLLARDAGGALRALRLADSRLAALQDPRLLPVREALAREQAALAALPAADSAGAALTLKQIMSQVAQLPLRARAPERFEPAPKEPADPAVAAGETYPKRIWSAVKTALSAMFTLRRVEGPALKPLAPEEAALAARILQLKLEGARLALLSGDGAALRDLAASAGQWLRSHYPDGDPAVRAALTELERIAQLDLNPAPPDISRSLELLRAQLNRPAS